MHKSFIRILIFLSFIFLVISKASAEGIWFPTDKPNCEVWNPQPQSEETALWSGACLNGKAHGTGVTTWRNKKDGKFVLRLIEGEMKNGRRIGQVKITYENGDIYVGPLSAKGNRHGQGTYTWVDGTKFEGGYKDGEYHGQGTLTYSNGKIKKELWKDGQRLSEFGEAYGEGDYKFRNGVYDINHKMYDFGFKTRWAENKYVGMDFELGNCSGSYLNPFSNKFWTECKGTRIFYDGAKYHGEFINGKRHGKGVYTLANGNRYVGHYEFHEKNGHGVYTYYNGDRYIGYFKDDKRHGNGIYTQPKKPNEEGYTYIGEYKNGKRHGNGYVAFGDGYTYDGAFKDGKLNGQGALTYPDGDEYIGSFKDGKLNGRGTFNYLNGDSYTGDFKDGTLSGHGTYRHPNGAKYVGSIKNSLSEGYGTYTAPDGKKYVGQWKKNKLDGYATIYGKDGKIKQRGLYREGVFVE